MTEPTEAELEVLSDAPAAADIVDEMSHIKTPLTCCDRFKLMFKPISIENKCNEENDETQIIITPEPFRMFFYMGFFVFAGIAIFVSIKWGGVDTEDNPIKNRFGANNTCIYFDNAPFSLFSATLWYPVSLCWLIYTFLDYYRARDSYRDNQISKGFWILYKIFTIYEVAAIVFSIQFTATTPYESIYIHTIPYLTMTCAFLTLSLKKFLYFVKTGMFDYRYKCWYYLGWMYVIALLISVIFKLWLIPANLFGARLWEIEGLEWTQPFSQVHDKVHFALVLIVPIFIYFVFTKECKTIKIVIHGTKCK